MARPPKDPNPKPSTGGIANAQGDSIFTGDWNAFIDDYVSQTDTLLQTIKSSLTVQNLITAMLATPASTSDIQKFSKVPGLDLARFDYLGQLQGNVPDFPITLGNAITVDNNFVSNSSSSSGTTITVSLNTTIEHWIVLGVIIADPNSVTSIADTIGNTYGAAKVSNDDANDHVYIYSVCSKASNANNIITVTLPASSEVIVFAYSLNGPILLGVTATNTGISANPSVSLTTQDSNNYVVAVATQYFGTPDTYTQENGMIRGQFDEGGSINAVMLDNTRASAGIATCSVTDTAGQAWNMVALEFRSALPSGTGLRSDSKIKFVDTYAVGYWLPPDTVVYDANNNGVYDAGDTVIYGTTPALNTTLTTDSTRLKYYSIRNIAPLTWSQNDPVVWDGNTNLVYDTTPALPIIGNLSTTGKLTVGGLLSVAGASTLTGALTVGGGGNLVGETLYGTLALRGLLSQDVGTIGSVTSDTDIYASSGILFLGSGAAIGTIRGLKFAPQINYSQLSSGGPDATISKFYMVDTSPAFVYTNFYRTLTITELVALNAGGEELDGNTAYGGNLVITTAWGIRVVTPTYLIKAPTLTDYYGLDIQPAPAFATNKWGVRQQGTEPNRLSGKTRIGDQTTPTDMLEVAGNETVTIARNFRSSTVDPVPGDIPAGYFAVWKNTTSGIISLWSNDAGTMRNVPLSTAYPVQFIDSQGNIQSTRNTVKFAANGGISFSITDDPVNGVAIVQANLLPVAAQLLKGISETGLVMFPYLPPGQVTDLYIPFQGVTSGMGIYATPLYPVEKGVQWNAFISAANTITLRVSNIGKRPLNAGNRSWRVDVKQ